MKRKTTKEILAESFREIAGNKPVDKITIQEIVNNCEYSPATFYRYFKDKYDLMAWDYATHGKAIMSRIDGERYEWRQTLFDGTKYFWDNREYLKNLFQHTSGHESFLRYVSLTNSEILKKEIKRRTDKEELDSETEIAVRVYCYGTVATICEWVLGEINATPDEMGKIFEASLPEFLRKYLY